MTTLVHRLSVAAGLGLNLLCRLPDTPLYADELAAEANESFHRSSVVVVTGQIEGQVCRLLLSVA